MEKFGHSESLFPCQPGYMYVLYIVDGSVTSIIVKIRMKGMGYRKRGILEQGVCQPSFAFASVAHSFDRNTLSDRVNVNINFIVNGF